MGRSEGFASVQTRCAQKNQKLRTLFRVRNFFSTIFFSWDDKIQTQRRQQQWLKWLLWVQIPPLPGVWTVPCFQIDTNSIRKGFRLSAMSPEAYTASCQKRHQQQWRIGSMWVQIPPLSESLMDSAILCGANRCLVFLNKRRRQQCPFHPLSVFSGRNTRRLV